MHTDKVLFFKQKEDQEPIDGYPPFADDKTFAFACYNWLQMHPKGKIVIENGEK
jgi:hypothetical protein